MSVWHDIASTPLLQRSYAAGLLAALLCGMIGPFVVSRRMVFLGEGIAHGAMLGVGLALAISAPLARISPALSTWSPIILALLAAIICALGLAWLSSRSPEKLDAMIGGLMALGLSGGLVLSNLGDQGTDAIGAWLFGSVSLVSWAGLWQILITLAVVAVSILLGWKYLLALCVDESHLSIQMRHPWYARALLLVLVAISVCALMQVVGLILVLALIALPAATVSMWSMRLPTQILWSCMLAALLTTTPRLLAHGHSLPPGPAIVLAAAGVFLMAFTFKRLRRS